jgi:uncharacterized protein with HEPN domain
MRDNLIRIMDILDAIHQIERYQPSEYEKFLENELIQVWIIHHIQQIGEASAGIDSEFRSRYQSVPWRQIVDMRNLLVHQYFGVDLHEIWNALIFDIPTLKREIERILKEG